MFWFRKRVKISKDRIAFHVPRIGNLEVSGIRVHGHDFLFHGFSIVGKIDTVAQGFAHLGFAINPWQPITSFIRRQINIRFRQGFPVNGIELAHNFPTLFEHRFLIFPNGNMGGMESRNISSLGYRVAEKPRGTLFSKFFC